MTDEIALLVGAPTREIEAMADRPGHVRRFAKTGYASLLAGITTLEEVQTGRRRRHRLTAADPAG